MECQQKVDATMHVHDDCMCDSNRCMHYNCLHLKSWLALGFTFHRKLWILALRGAMVGADQMTLPELVWRLRLVSAPKVEPLPQKTAFCESMQPFIPEIELYRCPLNWFLNLIQLASWMSLLFFQFTWMCMFPYVWWLSGWFYTPYWRLQRCDHKNMCI